MPVKRNFDPESRVVVFVASGKLSLQEMMDALLSWYEDPRFSTTTPVICDYTDCDWLPMFKEYEQIPDAVLAKINENQPLGLVAFVLRSNSERADHLRASPLGHAMGILFHTIGSDRVVSRP